MASIFDKAVFFIAVHFSGSAKARYSLVAKYLRRKGCKIGKNTRIGSADFGSEPYLVKIGNNCVVSTQVSFITHDGGLDVLRREIPDIGYMGKIEILDNCFIGHRAIILPNVKIGPNSVIGAGAVVTKDVPPNTVVAGVPAKKISTLEEYKRKALERKEKYSLKGKEPTRKNIEAHFWGKNKGEF